MRIALVSPYSWTYPGGVTRHIEALAECFIEQGHHVRVLAPYDPLDLSSRILHRGATPQPLPAPDYLVSLGRTVGFKANGAVSNLSVTPYGVATAQAELRAGGYDVVHIHEPVAPLGGWITTQLTGLPLVGTFHSFSESLVPNGLANLMGARRVLNRLHVRIAVSDAAAWTGQRFFGGHYRVIPNGVHVDPESSRGPATRRPRRPCASSSSVSPSSARGCRCCCAPSRRSATTSPPSSPSSAPPPRSSRRCCSTTVTSACWARSTMPASARSSSAPTSFARRRCAARASGWC